MGLGLAEPGFATAAIASGAIPCRTANGGYSITFIWTRRENDFVTTSSPSKQGGFVGSSESCILENLRSGRRCGSSFRRDGRGGRA